MDFAGLYREGLKISRTETTGFCPAAFSAPDKFGQSEKEWVETVELLDFTGV